MRNDDAAEAAWEARGKAVLELRCSCGKQVGEVCVSDAGLVAEVCSVVRRDVTGEVMPSDKAQRRLLEKRRVCAYALVASKANVWIECVCSKPGRLVDWSSITTAMNTGRKSTNV